MTILENISRLYMYFYKPRKDSVLKQKTKIINENIYIESNIVYKDKDYNLVFVSDTNKEIYNDLVEFNNNKINHILKKNMIVYASLNDINDNFVMDITDEIRKFCFYFDKQKHIGYFLHYLQDKYNDCNLIKNNLKIYNLKIYKNDECFSENTYNIQDIMYTEFNKIMV
jgi:hypothetical protein